MPLYALKCGGVLQLRENLADEREDHQLQVYQRGYAPSERRIAAQSSTCEASSLRELFEIKMD